MTDRRFFTSDQLRYIAFGAMLLDHLYVTVFPGQLWMNCTGRIAFPLFAFELVQGYIHTRDLRRYAARLLILALLSEIPFNMAVGASLLFPQRQNVVWTLLAGLAVCLCADRLAAERTVSGRLPYLPGLLGALLLPGLLMTDYGTDGVMLILLFWLTRSGGVLCGVLQAAVMFVMWQFMFTGRTLPIGAFELQTQCFALLSLPLIWLYNGRRSMHGRVPQCAAYAFYPVHLLILGAVRILSAA